MDELAWATLHEVIRPYIYAVCYRTTHGALGLSDDACQETLLKLVRSCRFEDLTDPGKFRRYAATAAARTAGDLMEGASRRVESLEPTHDPLSEEESAEALLEVNELRARALGALGTLDQEILRHVLDEWSPEEISR